MSLVVLSGPCSIFLCRIFRSKETFANFVPCLSALPFISLKSAPATNLITFSFSVFSNPLLIFLHRTKKPLFPPPRTQKPNTMLPVTTKLTSHFLHLLLRNRYKSGADDENRTHTASLEGWNSTIELHPHLFSL